MLPTLNREKRKYLKKDFAFQEWDDLKPFFEELLNRKIESLEELEKWLQDRSELDAYMSEDLAWRYIKYTCNTEDEDLKNRYLFYINEITPKATPYNHKLNTKLVSNEFANELHGEAYFILLRNARNDIELFRQESIPLQVKAEELAQQYSELMGQLTIQYKGEELTMSQAARYLKDPDRSVRKEVYELTGNRRLEDHKKMDVLMTELVKLRHQIAMNAGFENYRDYKFRDLARFDFTQDDVELFHESVKSEIKPIIGRLNRERKEQLNVTELRPYDMDVDISGKPALVPFKTSKELIEKAIACFTKLSPQLGEYLSIMNEKGFLDLESRKGKAPGGYNYPLDESCIPFIFMNSSGKFRDMITMLHEGGHAVHSFLSKDLDLNDFKHTPSEVAELASMSMELLTMDYWDVFFPDAEDRRLAKKEHLEGIIEILPWIATIDKFQGWMYLNPEHTVEERTAAWVEIFTEFNDSGLDYSGYEKFREIRWMGQLHIFESPFYYIEYGIAQLGALAVWKNYKENNKEGLENYLSALSLGYTKTVPEIYKTAGIEFNFGKKYIHELAQFVLSELEQLS